MHSSKVAKVFAVVLSVSIFLSSLVPASAVAVADDIIMIAPFIASYVSSHAKGMNGDTIAKIAGSLSVDISWRNVMSMTYDMVRPVLKSVQSGKNLVSFIRSGEYRHDKNNRVAVPYEDLVTVVEQLNSYNDDDLCISATICKSGTGINDYYYIRIREITSKKKLTKNLLSQFADVDELCFADETGKILICSLAGQGEVQGSWKKKDVVAQNPILNIVSDDTLYTLQLERERYGDVCSVDKVTLRKGEYYVLRTGENYWCSPAGSVYAVPVNAQSAVTIPRDNYTTQAQTKAQTTADEASGVIYNTGATTNTYTIDIDGSTLNLPDKALAIDSVAYNDTTQTYYTDCTDMNNTYTYNVQYHTDYTSITYLGASDAYESKEYSVYYQLPDGRNSADLTVAELEQLSLAVDVVNYLKSTDNTSIRALYHFDGNTDDSSYFNSATSFSWGAGSSISYLDSGAFNGCLYLGENNHSFTVSLPSTIGSGDFTLQFRYYQSATKNVNKDSFISIGGTPLIYFDGQSIRDKNSNLLWEMPIGVWNEIALVRSKGTLYYYLNGVSIGSLSLTSSFATSAIGFMFGSSQQTYKYLDELRVLNTAITNAGEFYTPVVVPYDTNLVMVLPDEAVAIPDEYWEFNTEGNLLPAYDFTSVSNDSAFLYSSTTFNRSYLGKIIYKGSAFSFEDGFASLRYDSTCLFTQYFSGFGTLRPSIAIPLGYSGSSDAQPFISYSNPDFHFSLLLNDGTLLSYHFTSWSQCFTLPNGGRIFTTKNIPFTGFDGSSNYYYGIGISCPSGTALDMVYMELKSDVPNAGHEYITSVAPVDTIDRVTLAVKSDLTATSYVFGGVRPSVPAKGQVWAMVENGYITSLQQYTGTYWQEVDGRIWTGARWIPYGAYNTVTMQDTYDIVGTTSSVDNTYIYSDSGFWTWLQKWLNTFKAELFEKLEIANANTGTAVADAGVGELEQGELSKGLLGTFSLFTFIQSLFDGRNGLFSSFAGLFSSFSFDFASGVLVFFAFVRGLWDCLPVDLVSLIWLSVKMLVLISVLRSIAH